MTNTNNEEWRERIYEKYSDKGNEMYGLAKHNNTLLERILDEVSEEMYKSRQELLSHLISKVDGINGEEDGDPWTSGWVAARAKVLSLLREQ